MASSNDAEAGPVESLDASVTLDREYIDVADLPPPEPLRATLERLADPPASRC